jgi:hypothetical protein
MGQPPSHDGRDPGFRHHPKWVITTPSGATATLKSPLVGDAGRAHPWFDQTVIYLGTFVFAAMAVLVVVIFVKKFRQSND